MKLTKLETVLIVFFSLLCGMALSMTFACTIDPNASENYFFVLEIVNNLRVSLTGKAVVGTLIAILCFLLGKQGYHRDLMGGTSWRLDSLLRLRADLAGGRKPAAG